MARFPLDGGLVEELAARWDAPPESVWLAMLALLSRRYTGQTRPRIRRDGGIVTVDLEGDMPVRLLPSMLSSGRLPTGDDGTDLAVALERTSGDGWAVVLDGCPAEVAACFAADLLTVLDVLTADPERSTVDVLPVSVYEGRRDIDPAPLHRSGAPGTVVGETIPEAFASQVALHPDRPAVLSGDGGLTYRALGSAVAAMATAIRAGAGDRTGPVAVLCRHGAETIIGLLGALVAGRAYVPLEPTYPPARLAEILAGSGAVAIVTDPTCAPAAWRLAGGTLPVIGQPDPVAGLPADELPAALHSPARPEDPAYLLYTSGSTGAPKGVVQSHRNVLFGVRNHVRGFVLTPDDRTSVLTSFGFDMAVTDTFSAILSGAAAVPVDIRTHGLGHLADTLDRQGVTVYHSTPTVYRYLLASLRPDGRLPRVRAVLLGGEEVTRHDVTLARRHFHPDTVFVNGYGTTEISFAAQYHIGSGTDLDDAVVPIGYPLPGVEVVLVDGAGRPTCLHGEMVIRSRHIALGYQGLPELTAQRFRTRDGVPSYHAGDLARRLPDGRLVFLGRADRMVKIRGYRVELGEIESRLAALPGVGQAVVVVQPAGIIGFVVPAPGATVDTAALRGALAESLPDHMLPRAVVPLADLPMGGTGKLDVTALPVWQEAPASSTVDQVGPDPLRQAIAAAWCEALGRDRVDPHASFVDLGGHSLAMALVQRRLEATLGRRLPLATLFAYPTVDRLAGHLRGDDGAPDPLARAAERMRRRRGRQVEAQP